LGSQSDISAQKGGRVRDGAWHGPEVLYIMGPARSGSTILEILLAANRELAGGGELFAVGRDGFAFNRLCSCGEKFRDCPRWSKVAEQIDLSQNVAGVDSEGLFEMMQKMDWHEGFVRHITVGVSGDLERAYSEFNRAIIRAMGKVTGCPVVVDSSKYVGRALFLDRVLDGRVKVIYLTRSPRRVLHSFQKQNRDEQPPRSALSALIYLFVVTLMCWYVSMRLGQRCIHVSFDALQADADRELARIAEWSGYDLGTARKKIEEGGWFSTGHIMTGNRLRKKDRVKFRRGSEKNIKLSGARAVVEMILKVWYGFFGLSSEAGKS
jgi:hypothetical protein